MSIVVFTKGYHSSCHYSSNQVPREEQEQRQVINRLLYSVFVIKNAFFRKIPDEVEHTSSSPHRQFVCHEFEIQYEGQWGLISTAIPWIDRSTHLYL